MSENKQEQLGIDLIENFIDTAFGTTVEVKNDLKDGKLSPAELIGLADNAFSLGRQGLNWKKFIAQCKDIDSKERFELMSYVINKGIVPEKAEGIFTHALALAEKLIVAYNEDVVPIINEIKELKNK